MTAETEVHPLLDPIAFAGALVLAPLLVTALTFALALIPVAALILGGLPYLVFGGPVFLWMVTRYPATGGTFAVGGLVAHVLFMLCFAAKEIAAPSQIGEMLAVFALFGVPFSAGWGATFGWLYRSFYRSPIRHFVR
jgi:hypothetical protein